MKLIMYIGNDMIESVPLDKEKIPEQGYLGGIKRSLKQKYREEIKKFAEEPEFLVIDLPQRANDFK